MDAPAAHHGPVRSGDGVASDGAVGSRGSVGSVGSVASDGLEARRPLTGGRRVTDVVTTVTLLVVLAVAALVAGGGIVFLSLAFHSCAAPGNTCDQTLGGAVVYVGPVLVGLVFVVTLVGCTVRLVRRRWAWPVAMCGLAGVAVVFLAAVLLVDSAVTVGV